MLLDFLQGESDTEENKSPSCARHNRTRTDSDVDEIDIKADILKNIGPMQPEGGQKSKDPVAKRREVQISFSSPALQLFH